MNRKNRSLLFIVAIGLLFIIFHQTAIAQKKDKDKSNLKILERPYLGQNPPGMIPEVFAPGIISKTGNHLHSCVSFSTDGREIYFTYRSYKPEVKNTINFIKLEDNQWSKVQVAPFSGIYNDDSPAFSPDGKRLYFSSNRPIDKYDESNDLNFWYVDRTESGWSMPVYAGDILNTDSCDFRLSISQDGTMYLSSDRAYTGRRSFDVFVSELVNGTYLAPQKMETEVNSLATEQVGFISPDESYLIFYRYDPEYKDSTGLYISFREDENSWTKGRYMGAMFNAPAANCTQAASLSPDAKYLFFLRRADEAIYWVDADIINNLKPKNLK